MSENKHAASDLAQMQSLPLESKIRMSKRRIKEWFESWAKYEICDSKTNKIKFVTLTKEPKLKETQYIISRFDGQVYVSFSGGKDSTVLADLCAKVCKTYGYILYLLFVNTGLEYPEIQKFVKEFAEWLRQTYKIEVVLDVVRPQMRFDQVIKTYGYPVISKNVCNTIRGAKNSINKNEYSYRLCALGVDQNEFGGLYDSGKYPYKQKLEGSKYKKENWRFLLDANFDVSEQCCDVMKKAPAHRYESKTKRKAIIGTLACESMDRTTAWVKNGCNAFNKKTPTSQPLSFWTEQDILHYIKEYKIPYCSVYGELTDIANIEYFDGQTWVQESFLDLTGELRFTGCQRTGCIFYMFGCHLEKEPNRFQSLKITHPRQYEYCIGGGEMVDDKWQPNKDGLGLGKVLDYINVKYD